MDFDDTPEESAFRSEVRAFLEQHAVRKSSSTDRRLRFYDEAEDDEAGWVKRSREWQHTKNINGFGAIRWPLAWGGRNGTVVEQAIFAEEEASFDVTSSAFAITLGMIAPTIGTWGTPAQVAHLPRILDGDELWCQLFSEPEAGSDLANMQCYAERDGDDWVVTGQKVWTSGAHYADWGYLQCRTDRSVAKHAGLTAFVLPMDTPGVTIRPLRQMTGDAPFNEVFFDGARLPDSLRLGPVGDGWRVALTTLMNERFSAGSYSGAGAVVEAIIGLVKESGRREDPLLRQRVAHLHSLAEIHRLTRLRSLSAASHGREPGPEGSLSKLFAVGITRGTVDLAMALLGPAGALVNDASHLCATLPGESLGGGTDEIQRNIIGERVLGLPPEPRVDKT